MKKHFKLLVVVILLTLSFVSCKLETKEKEIKTQYDSLSELLTDCEGYAVCVAHEYNEAKFEAYRHIIYIKDSTGTVREKHGGNFSFQVNDTIIKK